MFRNYGLRESEEYFQAEEHLRRNLTTARSIKNQPKPNNASVLFVAYYIRIIRVIRGSITFVPSA